MRTYIVYCGILLIVTTLTAAAASKPHVVSLGKFSVVKWFVGENEDQPVDLKIRPLYVDGRQKEFTLGATHEITDRTFVVRRAFRLNDALPSENGSPQWRWARGGWLAVDRVTGRVTALNLPEFDSYFSFVDWYRDYAAYCGVSDDGKKAFAMVVQVGRRKPILRKALGDMTDDDAPDSACPGPVWQRQPVRVTFVTGDEQKVMFAVHGHAIDVVNDSDTDDATE